MADEQERRWRLWEQGPNTRPPILSDDDRKWLADVRASGDKVVEYFEVIVPGGAKYQTRRKVEAQETFDKVLEDGRGPSAWHVCASRRFVNQRTGDLNAPRLFEGLYTILDGDPT